VHNPVAKRRTKLSSFSVSFNPIVLQMAWNTL